MDPSLAYTHQYGSDAALESTSDQAGEASVHGSSSSDGWARDVARTDSIFDSMDFQDASDDHPSHGASFSLGPVSRSWVYEGWAARILPFDRCSREPLDVSELRWFEPGVTVWHICYTPDRSLIDRMRRFVLTWRVLDVEEPIVGYELSLTSRTDDTAGWSMSVLFATPNPPDGFPLFNVRMSSQDRAPYVWAANLGESDREPIVIGSMTLLRVNDHGEQEYVSSAVERNTCSHDPARVDDARADILPRSSPCPPSLGMCRSEAFHCR